MKELLEEFIINNKSICAFVASSNESYKDGNEVLPLFAEKLRESKFNVALGKCFADLLQLSNHERVYEQYSLEDISKLYSSLIEVQKFNLENYLDAAYFEFSVMDNSAKAKQLINTGLEKAKLKVEELQRLLEYINLE